MKSKLKNICRTAFLCIALAPPVYLYTTIFAPRAGWSGCIQLRNMSRVECSYVRPVSRDGDIVTYEVRSEYLGEWNIRTKTSNCSTKQDIPLNPYLNGLGYSPDSPGYKMIEYVCRNI